MSEAKHKDGGGAPAIGTLLGSAFLKEAEFLIGAQTELLNNAKEAMQDWMQRQRDALDNSARSIHRMYECRNFVDLMQVQQQFTTDCLTWMAAEMRAMGRNAELVTRAAAARAGEIAPGAAEEARPTAKAARESAQSRLAQERAAAE
jgi:hypothetical protein